jgi:hypothetical protein
VQAQRWRNLQQQVSLKSSLSNTRQSITATASSDHTLLPPSPPPQQLLMGQLHMKCT